MLVQAVIGEPSRLALSLCFQGLCSMRLPRLPPPPLQDPEARPLASCLHPALLNPQSVFPELGPAAISPTGPQRKQGWCMDSCLHSQREEQLNVQMPLICRAQIMGGREEAVPSKLKAKKTLSSSLPSLPGRPRTARLTLTLLLCSLVTLETAPGDKSPLCYLRAVPSSVHGFLGLHFLTCKMVIMIPVPPLLPSCFED